MPNNKLSEFIIVIIALIAAFAAITYIKFVLIPLALSGNEKLSHIWALEVLVVLGIVAAFIFSEGLDAMGKIIRLMRRERKANERPTEIKPSTLIWSLAASILIYLTALKAVGAT